MKITILLAGIPVEIDMNFPDYMPYYEPYITTEKALGSVSITRTAIDEAGRSYKHCKDPIYVEHVELSVLLSDFLLNYDRVFFHGTAFIWRDKAWIISAPPETGKTTHFMLWKKLWGREVQILNGDKPVLECRDGGITVHPSPWNGKENMGTLLSAPLGGIVMLERGEENRIERLGKDAILPVYAQFLYSAKKTEAVGKVFALEDKILRAVPVWRLYTRGDEASARLCHDTIEEVLK